MGEILGDKDDVIEDTCKKSLGEDVRAVANENVGDSVECLIKENL
ncbi:hypothetical protein [Rossellomorea sp. LJF3]